MRVSPAHDEIQTRDGAVTEAEFGENCDDNHTDRTSNEVLLSLKEMPEGLSKVMRVAAAAKHYELGKLSSGRAADLAGLPHVSFLQALAQYGVAVFDLGEEELLRDLCHS